MAQLISGTGASARAGLWAHAVLRATLNLKIDASALALVALWAYIDGLAGA